MRRLSSSLLLVVLWSGFALPFLQAQPETIPACCRRDGRHHCTMSLKGDGFRANAPNCPWRHYGVLISPTTALGVSSSTPGINPVGHLRARIATSAIVLPALDITRQRGPPFA